MIFIPENSHIVRNRLGFNYCFCVRHIKIFHYLYTSHYGCCLVNNASFTGDGAYPEKYTLQNDVCAIDVGYLGKENYTNHTKQQTEIWKQDAPIVNLSSESYIIEPTGIYKPLFDYFNLYDEYDKFISNQN